MKTTGKLQNNNAAEKQRLHDLLEVVLNSENALAVAAITLDLEVNVSLLNCLESRSRLRQDRASAGEKLRRVKRLTP